VQFGTVTLLAVFFVALARALRFQEVRLWAAAWCADALALLCVAVVAFLHPPSLLDRLFGAGYAAGKTLFALLMVAGARNHFRRGVEVRMNPRAVGILVAVWSLSLGFFALDIAYLQLGQALMVGGLFLYGGVWVLLRPKGDRSRWLGGAMLVEGILFLHYVPMLAPISFFRPLAHSYLRYPSFFDAGAELFVALASLVALESSANQHLSSLNDKLLASQERLRQLVDLDPLTNLLNRRGFREEIERRRKDTTALIFLDLDNFKEINDRYGHQVGDECLRHFARELAGVFRAEDSLFRWGGDEFLVLCRDLDPFAAWERIEELRRRIAKSPEQAPPSRISAGVAILTPERDPEAVLAEADERMYADKSRRRPG
jgi:diguanylate cyclase (GGDEF)-like protein